MRDQYLKALDIFDSENTRFWTRVNLFTGMQLLVIAGLASNVDDLLKQRPIATALLGVAFLFSVFTVMVVARSRRISMGIYRTLLQLEEQNPEFILVKTYTKNTRSPMGSIAAYCVAMTLVLSVFWVVVCVMFLMATPPAVP